MHPIRSLTPSSSHWRGLLQRCLPLLLLAPVACGAQTAGAPIAEPDPSTSAAATTRPSEDTSSAPTTAPVTAEASTDRPTSFPLANDPCTVPADHVIGETAIEYRFEMNGEERPVGIRVAKQSALGSEATIVVMLNPPGGTWEASAGLADFIGGWLRPDGAHISVAPQPSETMLTWTTTETFNVEYLTSLFALLERSFCLEDAEVILGARGEATIAIAQAACSAELPIDLLYMQLGMVTIDGCEPPRPIPVLSIGRFGEDPPRAPHWDGAWDSPWTLANELTGGFRPDPDEVAEWAGVNGCTDAPKQETLPDPEQILERPTVVLSHVECDAPVIAFGLQNTPGTYGVDPDALDAASGRLYEAYELVLGR